MAQYQQTRQEPPVTLPDRTRPPRPVRGCDICAANERGRAAAERAGNIRAATTCEMEIRRHRLGHTQ